MFNSNEKHNIFFHKYLRIYSKNNITRMFSVTLKTIVGFRILLKGLGMGLDSLKWENMANRVIISTYPMH